VTGRLIEGRADLLIDREHFAADVIRRGPVKEASARDIATAIHKAFCEPRGFGGLAGEIHERMHREIAQSLWDQLPGGSG